MSGDDGVGGERRGRSAELGRDPLSGNEGPRRRRRPFELAEYLLRGDERFTLDRLAAAASIDAETTISSPGNDPGPHPHWTSWVDGDTEFRADIYGRDPALAEALR